MRVSSLLTRSSEIRVPAAAPTIETSRPPNPSQSTSQGAFLRLVLAYLAGMSARTLFPLTHSVVKPKRMRILSGQYCVPWRQEISRVLEGNNEEISRTGRSYDRHCGDDRRRMREEESGRGYSARAARTGGPGVAPAGARYAAKRVPAPRSGGGGGQAGLSRRGYQGAHRPAFGTH